MIYWKLWYADGSTYTESWEDCPSYGVVVCVTRDPTGAFGRWVYSGYMPNSRDLRGNEFFVKRPGSNEPYATDRLGLELFRSEGHPENCIKYGIMVDEKLWQRIQDKAVNDKDFPRGTPKRRSTD